MMFSRVLSILVAFALVGCVTTAQRDARAKTVQLQPGMNQAAVERIFGKPSRTQLKPASDDFGSFSSLFVPGNSSDELIWKYDREDMEIKFVNTSRGWVVNSWEAD